MTQTRTVPMAVLALALIGGSAHAQQDPDTRPPAERYGLRVHYNTSVPDLSGDTRNGTAESDFVDFNEDLGFQNVRTFDVRGIIQFRKGTKFRGGWTPLDYSGDQDAPKTFTYGDTRYERFTRVVSSAKGGYYSADIQWDFLQKSWGFLGLIVGAQGIDVDVTVVDVADNVREVDTYRMAVPVAGLAGRFYTGRFSFEGEISGLTVGDRGNVFDTHGMVRFHVSDRLALQGGYRLLRITGNEGDAEVNMRLEGWLYGLELSL